jgi:hypothetical protein
MHYQPAAPAMVLRFFYHRVGFSCYRVGLVVRAHEAYRASSGFHLACLAPLPFLPVSHRTQRFA